MDGQNSNFENEEAFRKEAERKLQAICNTTTRLMSGAMKRLNDAVDGYAQEVDKSLSTEQKQYLEEQYSAICNGISETFANLYEEAVKSAAETYEKTAEAYAELETQLAEAYQEADGQVAQKVAQLYAAGQETLKAADAEAKTQLKALAQDYEELKEYLEQRMEEVCDALKEYGKECTEEEQSAEEEASATEKAFEDALQQFGKLLDDAGKNVSKSLGDTIDQIGKAVEAAAQSPEVMQKAEEIRKFVDSLSNKTGDVLTTGAALAANGMEKLSKLVSDFFSAQEAQPAGDGTEASTEEAPEENKLTEENNPSEENNTEA